MQLGKMPPVLPALREEFGLSLVLAGWLASAMNAVAAVVGIAFGFVADRFGRRRVLLAGLILATGGSALGALAPSPVVLLIFRVVEGLGFVLVAVSAPGLIVQATAGNAAAQRFALGAWGTYVPAGMAIAMVLAAPIQDVLGWRGLWLVLAVLTGLFVPVFARGCRDLPVPAGPRASFASAGKSLTRPGPWLMTGAFIMYALQWYAVMIWLPTFAIEGLNLQGHGVALVIAFVVFANAPGNMLGAVLLRRGVARWKLVAAASLCMGVAGNFIFAGILPPAGQFACAAAFSFFGGMLPAALLAGAAVHARSQAETGVVNGVLVQGAQLGQLFGPPMLAIVIESLGGWQNGGVLLAGCAVLAIALAVALRGVELRLARQA